MHELKSYLESFGIQLSEAQAFSFETYARLLKETNEQLNLTRVPEAETERLHFIDSVALLKHYSILTGAKIIDIGTGAGLPGLPIKIIRPDIELVLLDARDKKVKFLKHVCAELKLNGVSCVHGRAETLAENSTYKNKFDFVCARAVSELGNLIELSVPLLKRGGAALLMKGPKVDEEIVNGKKVACQLGAEITQDIRYTIPGSEQRRLIVVSKPT